MYTQYFCSLPNKKGEDSPRHLFTSDEERIAEFLRREDEPGRGIFYCIGLLRSDATARNKENVTALPCVICDLDLKNIVEPREAVLACLKGLLLPPSEIRDSGTGLHAVWELKEPLTDGEGMEQAEAVMRRLVTLLAGDPLPTHRAALLRCVGSHNSKEGAWKQCHVIEKSGAQYDIFEFQDMFDLYSDRPLLNYKPKQEGNAHDKDYQPASDGPVDVEGRLAAMCFEGPGDTSIHRTQLQVTAALISAGRPVAETVERVLAATREAVKSDPACTKWDWAEEEVAIARMCYDLINKAMRQNGEDLGHCLPDNLCDDWNKAIAAGKRPNVCLRYGSFHVRSYPWEQNGSENMTTVQADGNVLRLVTNNEPQKHEKPQSKIGPRAFRCIDVKSLPRRQWFYGKHYMRKIISATVAPGGTGKSNLSLVEAISMAIGRDLIYGETIGRYRVWYHNAEDPQDEIDRRIVAVCEYYKIDQGLLEGWLFTTSGLDVPIKIATGNGELKIDKATVRQLMEGIEEDNIEVVTFDPLIAMHTTGESDNVKMRQVIDTFAAIANNTECAIEVVHHVRKKAVGQEEHTTADARGAGAIIDAVRSARVLNGMSKAEAEAMDVDDLDRPRYVRLDRGKANMVPAGVASWLKFESVILDNGDTNDDIPGDNVGVITRWDPPDLRIAMGPADKAAIQNTVACNPECREDIRSKNWVGKIIGRRFGLDPDKASDRRRIQAAIHELLKEGTLAPEDRFDNKGMARAYIVPGARKHT